MQIKFLTFNILHGGVYWDNLISFIREIEPDIMSLQEVFDSKNQQLEKRFRTIDEFKKEFPQYPFVVFEPTVVDRISRAPWGNAIFSKFPITQHANYFFNGELEEYDLVIHDPDPSSVTEGILEAQIDILGKNVYVYSWHGVWDRHGNDTPARDEMLKILTKAVKGKSPIILAGDTNLSPNTRFVKVLTEELNIQSVFGNSLVSTFNMRHKKDPGYAIAAVDMVFVSPEFQIVKKELLTPDASDHYPLTVTLEVLEKF